MNAATLDRLLWKSRKNPVCHPEIRLVATRNAEVRVRDTGGDKPVVVFFCDPPVTVEAYDALLDQFRSDYRVLIIELFGFGFSRPNNSSGYEFKQTVDAMEEILSGMETDAMVLCGPCICGFVVTELARRGRLPVKGLILMQTPDFAGMLDWCGRMDPMGVLRIPFLGQSLVHTTVEARESGAAFPLATMLQRWRKGPTDANLDIPTLAIWGRQDRSHRDTDPESTLKHAPSAQVVLFNQCGHFTELEQPEAFSAVALPFLGQCLND